MPKRQLLVRFALLLTFFTSSTGRANTTPFLIGWYGGAGATASLNALANERAAGANITIIYNPEETSGEILAFFLDSAARNGIRVLVQIPEEWIGNRSTKQFAPNLTAIQKFINTYKNHLAVYGWYLYDEPEYEQFPSGAELESLYSAIKSYDPDHPITMSFGDYHCWNYGGPGGDSSVQNYVMAADLILFDQYPIYNQAEFKSYLRELQFGLMQEYHRLEDIPYMIDNCVGYLKTHHTADYQGFIPILQAFKWSAANRYPTYSEFRYMVYTSLVRDVQGITFWNNYWSAESPETQTFKQDVAYPIMAEAAQLAAIAQRGHYDDPQISVNVPLSGPQLALTRDLYRYSFAYKFGSDDKYTYLIAVSESRQPLKDVVFTLPNSITATKTEVLFEKQTRTLIRNDQGQLTLTDSFSPFQVHVYRFLKS